MYATFVAADLHSKARCKLACGRALISRGPRCMQACSGELRSAIRSVIEQCTASHVSIVASKRRVGHILSYLMEQYFLCFFLYLPKGIYLCLFTTSRPRAYLIYIHAKPTRRQASKQPSGYTLRLRHTRVLFNVRAYARMRDTSPGSPTIYNFWGERRQ